MDIKQLAAYMSKPEHFSYVNAAANETEKKRRIDELKAKFLTGNFSSVANFSNSGYCEDNGSETGIYDDCQTFADFNTNARQQVAFSKIKSLVANSNVQKSLKEWILKKNNISKKNRAAKLEAQKAFSNR
jgi:hypothetical protein